MLDYTNFPAINATLNGTSAVLIVTGRGLIKRGRIAAHRACMIAAVVCSSLFLVSYIYYHAHAGVIRFQGQGLVRPVYFSILITHTILAAIIVPRDHYASAGLARNLRPPSCHCALDLPCVAICFDYRGGDLCPALSPLRGRFAGQFRRAEVAGCRCSESWLAWCMIFEFRDICPSSG